MKRKLPRALYGLGIVLLVLAIILCLPIILPYVAVTGYRYKRRLRAAANNFRCTKCGNVLGTAALELADTKWKAEFQELRRKHPHIRFRRVRSVHAICTQCGTQYRFFEDTQSFTEEPPKP